MIDTEDIKMDAAPEAETQQTASESDGIDEAERAEHDETSKASAEKDAAEGQNDKSEAAAESEPEEDSDTRYMRLMADFQNYKKRVEKEKKDLYSFANEKLVSELLDVLDNFERALDQEGQGDSFKEGMEMIFKQLGDVLKKSGLAEIPALGEEFDPNFHNAVMSEETDEYESGKVSGVMQKGYTLNGKVIRPSMVKVAG